MSGLDRASTLLLRLNVFANFASVAYVSVIGLVMVPAYISRLGAEAFGLVSFFIVLQTLFQLLDLGLTPTMSREAARFRGGAIDGTELRQLLRSFELIFGLVAAGGAAVLVLSTAWIASNWLRVEALALRDIEISLVLMVIIAALRWVSGLYRGMIAGFERQVWLGGFGCTIATASYVLVVPVLDLAGGTALVFLGYQLVVALAELCLLCFKAYRILAPMPGPAHIVPSVSRVGGVMQFALNIALTNTIWLALSNLDKLMLSRLLSLSEYGYYSIAVLLASGVMFISSPISTAILPRLAKLSVEGNDSGFLGLYRASTQVIVVFVMPACLVMAFFSEEVLWAWTGNRAIAREAWPILSAYALGNGTLAVTACAYYIQFGKGDLRLHVFGVVLFVATVTPALIWATVQFGAVGAGGVWLFSHLAYLAIWVPLVHRRFFKGLHKQWLVTDVLSPFVPALLGGLALHALVRWPDDRVGTGLVIVLIGITMLLLAAAGSTFARVTIANRVRSLVRA